MCVYATTNLTITKKVFDKTFALSAITFVLHAKDD